MALQIPKRPFTVEEYYRMGEAGIFTPEDRVELVEGEVFTMPPIGSHHAGRLDQLAERLGQASQGRWIVRVQSPIRLNELSEPQPDLCLLKRRDDFYVGHHPTPQDVLLVIEVADTSLDQDRKIKVPLYAKAGIPEVWVIALSLGWIEVYAEPSNGEYTLIRRWKAGETLVSPTIADLSLEVTPLFK
jgi:Uma2 family endonuclease